MTKHEIIEHYYHEVKNGMSFETVRNQLSQSNFSPEEIKFIIREIDNSLIYNDFKKQDKSSRNEFLRLGIFLTGLGLLITISTFFGIVNLGNQFILAYGPIIAGISVIIYSKSARRV